MTAARLHEHVILQSLFVEPPVAGIYFTSENGGSTFLVAKVRKVGGDTKPAFRLIGNRLRKADVPPSAIILPWPKQPKRPSRAAESPRATGPIVTRAAAQQAERKRVVQMRRRAQDPNHQLVDPIRIANATAQNADWRDPDDLQVHRRTARVIHGVRARDAIEELLSSGTLNKKHARSGRRFRRLYELGHIGTHPTKSLAEAPSGFFSSGGPSESRLAHLAEYNFVVGRLGPPLTQILLAVIIAEESMAAYAIRRGMNRSSVAGYLLAAVDSLVSLFEDMDKEKDDGRDQESERRAAT